MSYFIKEIFYTLQGEGRQSGRPALFCRFTGCNLWSGQEKDRAKAICQFCDTDFIGTDGVNGGVYRLDGLLQILLSLWPDKTIAPFIVLTGGEPLLQIDLPLINALKENHFFIALETNGSILAPKGIDWICVSPKVGSVLKQTFGQELKLVYPQKSVNPADYIDLNFQYFFLQPCDDKGMDIKNRDNKNSQENIQQAIQYCLAHPRWSLSLQTHKILGID